MRIPTDDGCMFAVQIDRAEHDFFPGGVNPAEQDGIRSSGVDECGSRTVVKRRMGQQKRIQFSDVVDQIRFRSPGKTAGFVHVDFFFGKPFHAVGETERPVHGSERGERSPHPRIILRDGGKTRVVVCFRIVHHQPVAEGFFPRIVQIAFDLFLGVVLKQFGIRPVHICIVEQARGDGRIAAEPFQQKDDVGKFFPDAGDDVFPCGDRDHVTGVTAETVHPAFAPDYKDVGDVFP